MSPKASLLTSIFLVFIILPSVLLAGDLDGKWIAKVNKSTSACKNIGVEFHDHYVVWIKQEEGNTITATVEITGNVFPGFRQAANLYLIHLMGSYLKDAGIVTQYFDLQMSDSNSGLGSSVWTWSNGMYNCGGSYSFTLERAID